MPPDEAVLGDRPAGQHVRRQIVGSFGIIGLRRGADQHVVTHETRPTDLLVDQATQIEHIPVRVQDRRLGQGPGQVVDHQGSPRVPQPPGAEQIPATAGDREPGMEHVTRPAVLTAREAFTRERVLDLQLVVPVGAVDQTGAPVGQGEQATG